jgi:hypothetical protein
MCQPQIVADIEGVHKGKARKRRLVVLAITVIVILALLAVFTVWTTRPSDAARSLDVKLAQLRAAGVPLTPAELASVFPDPDPQHDAHLILHDAFAVPIGSISDVAFNDIWKTMLRPSDPCSEAQMKSLQLFLANSDILLQSIPDRLDGVWYSVAWTRGLTNLTLVPFKKIRAIIHTLAFTAIYEAERNNPARAAEALRKGFSVTRTINRDVMVNAMIRVACAGMLCDAAQRTLNRCQFSDTDLLEIQRQLEPATLDDFGQAFMVERCMASLGLEPMRRSLRLLQSRPTRFLRWQLKHPFYSRNYRDEDYLTYLIVMDQHQAINADRQLCGLERLRRHEQLDAYHDTKAQSYLAIASMLHWAKAIQTATRNKSRVTALCVSLAIERYRLGHRGALPAALEDLVPRYLPCVPGDPVDNQPLRYKRLSPGYVIYSVGLDGIDNGGTRQASAPGVFDITFTVKN